MMPKTGRFWNAYCVMDSFDEAMLSVALRDVFPTLRIMSFGRHRPKPDITFYDAIHLCPAPCMALLVPPHGWKPKFLPYEGISGWYDLVNHPTEYIIFHPTRWMTGSSSGPRKWVFDLPMPERGSVSIGPWFWNEEEIAFRKKVSSILGKLTVNRLKHWFDRDQVLAYKDAPRRSTRAGRHVLEWARQGERRMLDGVYRPCDDWKSAKTAWYAALEARVQAAYGGDMDDQPPDNRLQRF
ncbi:MAG: hypothetical protein KDE22_13375 [Rhodobacterales bacterium]|nr:hypothetical protein [Rhodobacterales bacterium]